MAYGGEILEASPMLLCRMFLLKRFNIFALSQSLQVYAKKKALFQSTCSFSLHEMRQRMSVSGSSRRSVSHARVFLVEQMVKCKGAF